MGSLWKKLAEENYGTIFRNRVGEYEIQVIDEFLTPVVEVKDTKGTVSKTELEKVGIIYSDGDSKFYDMDSGEVISNGELNDRAVEAHLEHLEEKG